MRQKTLDIQILVAKHYSIDVGSLHARSKRRTIARARHMAMLMIRRYCDLSYPELGALFEQDHTTAMAACRRAEDFPEDVAALRAIIEAKP